MKISELNGLEGDALKLAEKQAKALIKKGLKKEEAIRIAIVTGSRLMKQRE